MSAITRTDAEALIREQNEPGIVQNPAENSAFLNLARRLTDMTSGTTKVPVLSMLPMAYWVNGDSGYKQSSKAAWDNVFLHAAELAVIVPIPEAVLEDADFGIRPSKTGRSFNFERILLLTLGFALCYTFHIER